MDDDKILVDVKFIRSDTEEPVPGTLYLTLEGIAFVPHKSNNKATFLLTYDRIKKHEHTGNGPLTFVLKDKEGGGPCFEFERVPLRDLTRNVFEILKALHQGLGDKLHPEQRMPDAKETELRDNALNADSHLKKLRDELVVAEILPEFEFWATTKTWLDLSSLKIPNAQTRSHTEGLSQSAGEHSGTTDTEINAIDQPADETLELEASPDSSELKPSKETVEMESSQHASETSRLNSSNETPELNPSQRTSELKSSKEASEAGSSQEIAELESPQEKSELKLSQGAPEPDVESQEESAQSLADPSNSLQVISTEESSDLSRDDDAKDPQALHFHRLEKQQMRTEKYILTRIGDAEMNLEAKIDNVEKKLKDKTDNTEVKLGAEIDKAEVKLVAKMDEVEAKLEAKVDKVEANLEARIDKVEEKIDDAEEKLGARIDKVEEKLEAKIVKVEEKLEAKIDEVEERLEAKLESIGKMLATFIAKQDMAAAGSGSIEARRSEVIQIADAEELYQTKTILDLYPEEHHQKILQSGLPGIVKEELLFDNIHAGTLMAHFDAPKPRAGLFAYYKAGRLRNAMADVLEKLKKTDEPPEVIPLVNPMKKRLASAIGQFSDFVREQKKKTNKRVKN